MAEILYRVGDATEPVGEGSKVIVHVCNDRGGWGRGFVNAISAKWSGPEQAYRTWYQFPDDSDDLPFALGQVQFVKVEQKLWVANLLGQHGYQVTGGKPPVRYDAIAEGLQRVASFAQEHSASIHMPRIGCGLAGGDWETIEPILKKTLTGVGLMVTVYDLGKEAE